MHQPVDIGAREHDRRNAVGQPANRGVQRPVHGLEDLGVKLDLCRGLRF